MGIASAGSLNPSTGLRVESRITEATIDTNYHRKKATTKYESLFRCLLVRGFASDRVLQERARCAWTWRGGPSRAGISTSVYRQLSCHVSCPGPAQSPHAQWLPSKPPHTLTRKGVALSTGLSCECAIKRVRSVFLGATAGLPSSAFYHLFERTLV